MTEWIITSSILILVVMILRYMLKGKIGLRLQYALWALVLLRLLVPVSPAESRVSVMNVFPAEVRSAKIQNEPVVPKPAVPTISPAAAGAAEDISGSEAVVASTDTAGNTYIRSMDWGQAAIYTWLMGIAAVGLSLLISNIRFAGKLKRTRRNTGISSYPLPVYKTDAIATPCMFGLFRPAIYVTSDALSDETTLWHVLEHETTHWRHKDHIWSLLRCVCLALHWYNPLVWSAALLSMRDAELACDEATIKRIGEAGRGEYGRTLIGLTCKKRGAGVLLCTTTTMTGGKKSIRERILLISKRPKTAAYTLVAVILTAAVAVGCTFTGASKTGERRTIFSEGGISITVASDYADRIYLDSLYGGTISKAIANIYYKPDYVKSSASAVQTCGGWMMSVMSFSKSLEGMESDTATEYIIRASDNKAVYVEEYPADGAYHYKDHPENTEIYEAILKSIQVDYGDLEPYQANKPSPQPENTPQEGRFDGSTGNIHDYMPGLLAGKAVSAYDLLPCLGNFTRATWPELDKTYGTGGYELLWTALRDAAVSDVPEDPNDQTLRDYYLGKAFLMSDGAYSEGLADIIAMQWGSDSALYSTCLKARFTAEEAAAIRQTIMYSMSLSDGSTFGLAIPGSGRSIYLGTYPVDFPFGFDLSEKSRESHRAESFGQVTAVESDGLQVTYLNNSEGVYTVITVRADKKNYASSGVAIGDTEESLLTHWPDKLRKLDGISYDDEAWFGKDYDSAYAYTPEESTKSILFLVKGGKVSGIEMINGLDGKMY